MEYPDFSPTGRQRFTRLWAARFWAARLAIGLAAAAVSANAAELDVTVYDRYGRPVPNVAVFVEPDPDVPLPAATSHAAVTMVETKFAPDLLVVRTGTRVRFSNRDQVAHHVYSFSTPNDFVLPMFKGNRTPRVELDNAGVVTIGCNLHDDMVAYILVVDSPAFGKTGPDGTTRLIADNPDGLAVSIWSPRLQVDDENLTQSVRAGRSARLTFSLTGELRSSYDDEPETFSWNDD